MGTEARKIANRQSPIIQTLICLGAALVLGGCGLGLRLGGGAQKPTLLSVNPSQALFKGGYTVTLAGQNFEPGMVATIGGIPCTAMAVASASTATCVAPSLSVPGIEDVVITTSRGSSTLPQSFTAVTYAYFPSGEAFGYGFTILPNSGQLVQNWSFFLGGVYTTTIAPHPLGTAIFFSTWISGPPAQIAGASIDPVTGNIGPANFVNGPANSVFSSSLALEPTGNFLYVTDMANGAIVCFQVTAQGGVTQKSSVSLALSVA